LLKGAMAGASAMVLGQAGIAAAQTPTAPDTRFPAGAGRREAGPNEVSAQPAYVVPTAPGVLVKAILSVGETAANGYKMVGIPDGMGAIRNGETFTLVVNHELGATAGAVRAHGSRGAFVSQWRINRNTLEVLEGKDLTPSAAHVHLFSGGAFSTGTTAWGRLCSGDLALPSAYRHGNLGTSERIFLNGEEINGGRGFAHIVTGSEAGHSWQLPRLGLHSFENSVASPHGKMKTVVWIGDDGDLSTAATTANPCELWFYIGTKQSSGNTIERAGLTNGKLYGVQIYREQTLVTEESEDFGFGDSTTGYVDSASFRLVEIGPNGDVSAMTGPQITAEGVSKGLFRMQRIEDGAWDPRTTRPRDLYFVTTASPTLTSRLYHMRFNDVNIPENGGKIEILINASPGRMFDNICIDSLGRLLLQEDAGNNPHVSKIYAFGLDTGELIQVAEHDPARFIQGGANFITQDEESSGIIDAADIIGPGWFIFDVEIHKASLDPALVEEGQMNALYVPTHIARSFNNGGGWGWRATSSEDE
jgi:hypothetical protein